MKGVQGIAVSDLLHTTKSPAIEQASLASVSMRDEFIEWLSEGNAGKYSPNTEVVCMDKISEYALRKKISSVDIWSITQYDMFHAIYQELLGAKLLRITNRNIYRVFVFVGQLYLKFLKDKPFSHKSAVSETVSEEKTVDFVEAHESQPRRAVDPEDVIAWLVTQPNANGTLYLDSVVRQYMSALRSAPAKLDIPVALDNRSVFTCQTPRELCAYWDVLKTAPNYMQVNTRTSGAFSAGMSCLLRYLEHLSESGEDNNTIYSDVIQLIDDLDLEYVDKRDLGGALWVIGGQELTSAMKKLRDFGFVFIYKVGGRKSSDYRDAWWYKPSNNTSQRKVTEPEQSRAVVVERIDSPTSAQCVDFPRPAYSTSVSPQVTFDPAVIHKVTQVLSERFANGFRVGSPIELARLRHFMSEDTGEEMSLTDDKLMNVIVACGTSFDGKVYVVSAETKEQIKALADEYFESGAKAIFYAEFYARNENWLFGASVVSEDMLIGILRSLFPKLSFTQTYFGYMDVAVFHALESEVLRVWGDDVLLTYEQLAERLQCIPIERIKYALGQNADFIRSRVETYSHVSKIDITEEEREAIRKVAQRECNVHGYVSITDLPFGEIAERNYELSITAIHNAVFRICLSDKYDKNDKIVIRKGDTLDALTIMKNYCRTIDKCSLGDLLDYARELTGKVHPRIPMEAGSAVLARIDKDTYVADKYVDFDADAIDEAISRFVADDYLPLKAFTTFGAFPDCGHTWNLFLLESYCRRFSKRFRFDSPSANSRNTGAVIRKSCGMSYIEIMTDAVANSSIPLDNSVVGKFLYECGYTGKSTNAKVGEIIEKAKTIRERRS